MNSRPEKVEPPRSPSTVRVLSGFVKPAGSQPISNGFLGGSEFETVFLGPADFKWFFWAAANSNGFFWAGTIPHTRGRELTKEVNCHPFIKQTYSRRYSSWRRMVEAGELDFRQVFTSSLLNGRLTEPGAIPARSALNIPAASQ